VEVPLNVEEVFGSRSCVPVKGAIEGVPYRSSLMPQGEGRFILVVNKTLRDEIGKEVGDAVEVTMEPDTQARTVEIPEDLAEALQGDAAAEETFERFSYSKRKEYVDWIESAKRPETRSNRIRQALEKLAQGRSLK
jgi:hypothetical protein